MPRNAAKNGRVARTQRDAIIVTGMAFLWPCLHMDAYSPLTPISAFSLPGDAMARLFLLFSCVCLVVTLAFGFFERKSTACKETADFPSAKRLSRWNAMFLLSTLAGVLGTILGMRLAETEVESTVLWMLCLVLVGLWFIPCVTRWISIVSMIDGEDAARNVFASYALYLLLDAMMITIGSDTVLAWFLVVCIAVSGITPCLLGEKSQQVAATRKMSAADIRSLCSGVGLPGLLFLVFGQAAPRLMPVSRATDSVLDSSKMVTVAISMLAILILLAWVTVRDWDRTMEISMFALLSIVIASGFFLALYFNHQDASFYKHFIIAGVHCMNVFMLVQFASFLGSRRIDPTAPCAAFTLLCQVLPGATSNLLLVALPGGGQLDVSMTSELLSLGVLLILSVTVLSLVRFGTDSRRAPEKEKVASLRSACTEISEEWGLSAREQQAMFCACMGMTADETANELGIAATTAKTHIRHVYEKLGVHSRAELIELVSAHAEK